MESSTHLAWPLIFISLLDSSLMMITRMVPKILVSFDHLMWLMAEENFSMFMFFFCTYISTDCAVISLIFIVCSLPVYHTSEMMHIAIPGWIIQFQVWSIFVFTFFYYNNIWTCENRQTHKSENIYHIYKLHGAESLKSRQYAQLVEKFPTYY